MHCYEVLSSFLLLWLLVASALAQGCDKRKCKGPVRFYEDLQCKPLFQKKGDCCAVKYDCSHLYRRSRDKCHVNGHEYLVGQVIKDEDAFDPCDKRCFCYRGEGDVARFSCPLVNCFPKEAEKGCYLRGKLDSCCGAEQICPKNPGDRLKCNVNGKTYLDGERFYLLTETNVICQCMKGYKGKNEAPFCRKTSCGVELINPFEIRENCAPIYETNDSLIDACNSFFRCQNANDKVITKKGNHDVSKVCQYGKLKLHIGDELNQSTDSQSSCVQCVCEVPPALTCKRLSDKDCRKKYPRA